MFRFSAQILLARIHVDSVRLNLIFLSVQLRRGINSPLPRPSTQSRKGGWSRVDLSSPLTHGELAREAGDLMDMWEKRVTEGKPVPPVRRAIAAPAAEHGPTPIQLLLAKYNRNKSNGMV